MPEHFEPRPVIAGRLVPDVADDGAISLKPLFEFLSTYRHIIALAMTLAVTVTTLGLIATLLVLPAERTMTLQFRLLFDGAENNKYPNDTAFSPAEIVQTSVLKEVYKANDLEKYGTYEDFKNSFAVLASSRERELLDQDYTNRLADNKLSPVDRTRIEDEYRRKRDAIKDPVFALSMRRTERFQTIPVALAEKTLNDILAVWARQAVDEKGALRFKVDVLSRNLLSPAVLDQEFLLAADSLRTQTVRLLKMATELGELPGAATVRNPKDNVSLAEVKASIEDIQRYQIHPLLNIIRSEGVAKDPQAISRFVGSQVAQVGIARDVTKKKIDALQSALQTYMSRGGSIDAGQKSAGRAGSETSVITPQLSESFLDRLVEMSAPTQAAEVAYRQRLTNEIIEQNDVLSDLEESFAFYQDLDRSMKTSVRNGSSPAHTEEVNRRLHEAFNSVTASVDKLFGLYDEMSRVSLHPASLYVVTKPFTTQTRYALSTSFAVLCLMFSALLAVVITPLFCLAHRSRRRRTPMAVAS